MNKFKNSILITFCTMLLNNAYSQITFWADDFSGYADGVTTGANNNTTNPANDWTSGGCGTCPGDPNDWWEIRSGVMEARDVNNENVFLQTESMDISTYTSVIINVDVLEGGDLEGLYLGTDDCLDAFNQDYADVEYRIDGGAWTLVPNYLGWCGLYNSCGAHTLYGDDGADGDCRITDADWGSTTVTVSGLSGNTLEIRLSTTNSAGTEFIRFDNINVQYTTLLPIELLSFTAEPKNSHIDLYWQTASEITNDYFTIERSINGFDWQEVIKIDGAGNSSSLLSYSTTDNKPYSGVSYYRLKQTDFNGQFEYSQVRNVNFEKFENSHIELYPNPVHNQLTITGDEAELKEISIYNLLGKDVTKFTKQIIRNKSKLIIDLSRLNTGMYYVKTKTTANKVYKQ